MSSGPQTLNAHPLVFAGAALVAWLLFRVLGRSISASKMKWLLAPFSLTAGWFCWDWTLQSFDSYVETASDWPRGFIAFTAALACDIALSAYVDRRGMGGGAFEWLPIGIRLGLIACLACIMMEPVVSKREERTEERQVAVLVDSSASMDLNATGRNLDDIEDTESRLNTARRLLLGERTGDQAIVDRLEEGYGVRLFEFASSAREMKLADLQGEQQAMARGETIADWRQRTDMAAAVERLTDRLPVDELSGVILLTDGCDHSQGDLKAAVGELAREKIPLHTVLIGDQTPISDAKVSRIQIPQHVFVGDSVAIRAPIQVDRLPGQRATVRLLKDGEEIDQQDIETRGKRYRQTVVFKDRAKEIGVHEYSVVLDTLPGERIKENNHYSSRVWVSKDYIRMLIVENRPRWEFRYLKNLFAGRDRSVQLQYVLLHPDRLAAVPDPPTLHASANRSFDDCEATALPVSEEEWMKFDVIVLGDVSPEDLGTKTMETLEKFTAERGGSLVVVAGRHYMPHAFGETPLVSALPVRLNRSRRGDAISLDGSYYFKIASGADSHVIMQQSSDPTQNKAVWQSLPELYWRHPLSSAKPGATVLAYAGSDREGVGSVEDQRDRALILWHRFGAGKVMQLTFDQTWRLRYGVGDQHHHRFWGQVLRWSVQDRLAAGTDLVRLGTDRVLYRRGDSVRVKARLLDEDRNVVKSQDTIAAVYLGDELVQKTVLSQDADTHGLLTGTVDGLEQPGKYRIELSGPTVSQLLRSEGRSDERVTADFALDGTDAITEMSDLVADATVPNQLADLTGGIVVGPSDVDQILEQLGPKSSFFREQWTVPLWNVWPVIVSFLLMLSAEWGLRKASGLI